MTTGTPPAASLQARAARATLFMAALLFAVTLSGCGGGEYFSPKLPYAQLAIPYTATQLGRSTSLEVLNVAHDGAYQFDSDQVEQALLTQGDTVIAYSGRSADTRKTWLNLIVFDEYRMTARRKYFFCIDERAERVPDNPKKRLFPPRKGILFDAQFVIDPEVLTTPYATEEAQRVAILQWLSGQVERDIAALVGDAKKPAQGSDAITLSGMMTGQVFQGVLVQLNKSPGLAKNLADERGIAFPHMSLDQGRIRLQTQNDLAAVTIRVNLPMAQSK
ncbi:MAG: hypothetical protein ABFE01_07740 [Phycisphaerales bacterium]|jgi:hypothetical protein